MRTTTPTGPPGSATAVIDAAEAEAFVRIYYDAVAARDYERSWAQLTPEFQRSKARSYDYYVAFWDDNDVEVGDVVLIEAEPDRAIVDVDLRWNGASNASTDRFELLRDADSHWLIGRQDPVTG